MGFAIFIADGVFELVEKIKLIEKVYLCVFLLSEYDFGEPLSRETVNCWRGTIKSQNHQIFQGKPIISNGATEGPIFAGTRIQH